MSTNQSTRFKEFRTARGWTQKRMALEIGVTQPTIARVENGIPPSETAVKLLDQYEKSGYGLEVESLAAQAVPS